MSDIISVVRDVRMKKAFTLVELLIVIIIIGILATIAIPQYNKMIIRSKWTAGTNPFLKQIVDASDVYYVEYGFYATDITQLPIDNPNDLQNKFYYAVYPPTLPEFIDDNRRAIAELKASVDKIG